MADRHALPEIAFITVANLWIAFYAYFSSAINLALRSASLPTDFSDQEELRSSFTSFASLPACLKMRQIKAQDATRRDNKTNLNEAVADAEDNSKEPEAV